MDMLDADTALAALEAAEPRLTEYQNQILSEADTRAKILDVLLKDVLGWDEGRIKREQRLVGQTRVGYCDYVLVSESNSFVVEAKRTGAYFALPRQRSFRARTSGILAKSAPLHAAISQLRRYCKEKKARLGVASNGLQLVVVLTSSPAQAGDYDAVIFDGIDDIRARFVIFWNILNPYADGVAYVKELLSARRELRAHPRFQRLLDTVYHPDESISRNPIDAHLRPVIATYFSDISSLDKREVLRECYCDNVRLAQYEKQLERLLEDRPPKIDLPAETVRTKRRSAGRFQDRVEQVLTLPEEGTALLLVGGVGVGKTTFLHRFAEFILSPEIKARLLWLYVDFLRLPNESGDIEGFLADEMQQHLSTTYGHLDLEAWPALQQVYEADIARMRRGPWHPLYTDHRAAYDAKVSNLVEERMLDKPRHVEALIRYARRRLNLGICLVLDNADQLSQEFQTRAVAVAVQKAKVMGCLSILAIRDETYWRLRRIAPFDAYQSPAFHVVAPRVKNLLAKRLEAARKAVGGEVVNVRSRLGKNVRNISLGEFLEIIVDSFLGKDEDNIVLLEALSANNMRLALDMFQTFLSSGHTNTDEYIQAYITTGSYNIPHHALVRSLALGDRRHYDSEKSRIINLFSVEDDGFYSHFTKVRILHHLDQRKMTESPAGRGFVSVPAMFTEFQEVCSDEEGLRRSLQPLLRAALVDTDTGARVSAQDANFVKLSAAGHYYLNYLMERFAYLDQVCLDTPIQVRSWFDRLHSDSRSISSHHDRYDQVRLRLERAEHFLEYLAQCEAEEDRLLEESSFVRMTGKPVTDRLREALTRDKDPILEGARRASDRA
jgi:hypothetical protein